MNGYSLFSVLIREDASLISLFLILACKDNWPSPAASACEGLSVCKVVVFFFPLQALQRKQNADSFL